MHVPAYFKVGKCLCVGGIITTVILCGKMAYKIQIIQFGIRIGEFYACSNEEYL